MGQEQSQQISHSFANSQPPTSHYESIKKVEKLQHEGLLKISSTPFKNCDQIQFKGMKLFLEHTRISLKELLRNKIKLKKSFNEEQIWEIIKNITYALAYLENIKTPYPLINASNIFFVDGNFKLLPPQIVGEDNFQLVKNYLKNRQCKYAAISPEMVIGIRCQQSSISQRDILLKGNVFEFGMLILEVCTLKPSSECYDLSNYDILGDVIGERIDEAQGKYSKRLVRVLANMLDYDYEERMTPTQLSIYVNRQILQKNKEDQIIEEEKVKRNEASKAEKGIISAAASRLVQEPEKIVQKSRRIQINEKLKCQDQGKICSNELARSRSKGRLHQIKQKIQREKLKIQIPQQKINKRTLKSKKQNISSRKSPTRATTNSKKQPAKHLPNPYLNFNYYCEVPPKQSKHSHAGYMDRNQTNVGNCSPRLCYNQTKYQYSRDGGEGIGNLSSQRDRSINLKYKYNLDAPKEDSFLNPAKVLDRKNQAPKQKKKSHEDYCDRNYQPAVMNQDNEQIEKQRYSKSAHQDFGFTEVPQEAKFGEHQNVLKEKQNNFTPYERHQMLDTETTNPPKSKKKGQWSGESAEMKKIRIEIEKSKRIVEEVRKSEQQYNNTLNF